MRKVAKFAGIMLALAGTAAGVGLAATAMAKGTGAHAPYATTKPAVKIDPALLAVLADPRRDKDRARDIYRHPAETLAFFRIKPGMTVVDYLPSGGWFTRILVPYLGDKGQYIGLNPAEVNLTPERREILGDMADKFPAKAAEWTGVPASRILAFNGDTIPAARKGTVDRAIIMREVHNIWPNGWLHPDLLAIRSLLKDDGLLGIEEHRAKPGAPFSETDSSKGYMREKDVIALVEANGFQLVAKSEINANPKDSANWPDGVWTLPPSYFLKDKDRAKYQAIGESDRMTLLFRKRP
ncbi:class I SAM-dependent methyltransferase [Novosphingobium sp. FKTRR1]|uniref:class I SAM-dependent methyltransferase n=1 Tax=Novosphingobium sp. FKTRR1 TaxID=2879118 RepID=UPI001CF075EF|nr:methyltransferase [Novosphingobium sp. FKTRR1]